MKKMMTLLGLVVTIILMVEVVFYVGMTQICKFMNEESVPGETVVLERQGFLDYDFVIHQEKLFGLYENETRIEVNPTTILTGQVGIGE